MKKYLIRVFENGKIELIYEEIELKNAIKIYSVCIHTSLMLNKCHYIELSEKISRIIIAHTQTEIIEVE